MERHEKISKFVTDRLRQGSSKQQIALLAPTYRDAHSLAEEVVSGLRSTAFSASYEQSKRRLKFGDGTEVRFYSGTEPDALRGAQHHAAILVEADSLDERVLEMLMFGLRLDHFPVIAFV